MAVATAFQNRYRVWCLDECKAESARDFRLVRMVQDTSTSIFFSFIEPLTPNRKKESIIALSKGMHCPESMSRRETEIYDRFRKHWTMPFEVGGKVISALRTTPLQMEIQEKFLRSKPSQRMFAQSLRTALKSIADIDFGRLIEDRPSILVYERPIGTWYVLTSFELIGHSQLRYAHHIHASSGGKRETRIYSGISILHWTGIHPDTTWSWLLTEDIPRAAESVREICVHFLNQVSELLSTLKTAE